MPGAKQNWLGFVVELEHSRDRSTDASQRALPCASGTLSPAGRFKRIASGSIDRGLRPSLRSAVRWGRRRITPMEGRSCQPILNDLTATKMNGRPDLECGAP